MLLATIISFPLAYLFELGGNTIWASALLHFTVQGAIKILEFPGDAMLPVVWMAASAAIPYLAFAFGRGASETIAHEADPASEEYRCKALEEFKL